MEKMKVLFIPRKEESIVVEWSAPYRMSVFTDKGVRAAGPWETLTALLALRQNGRFGLIRLSAILIRKLTMSLLRSSQQQLLTDHTYTPEERLMFGRWEKAMDGSHDLPQ